MSLTEYIGRVGSGILNPDETNCKMVRLPHPILNNTQLDILCNIRYKGFNTTRIELTSPLPSSAMEDGSAETQGGEVLRAALDRICKQAEKAVDEGFNYIILTDKITKEQGDESFFLIPSLLAVSAVHHYLISVGKRVRNMVRFRKTMPPLRPTTSRPSKKVFSKLWRRWVYLPSVRTVVPRSSKASD